VPVAARVLFSVFRCSYLHNPRCRGSGEVHLFTPWELSVDQGPGRLRSADIREAQTMFRQKKLLILANLADVPHGPGVYLVYTPAGQPFYVGRSTVNIRNRLVAHVQSRGSVKIAQALGRREQLTFEWEELGSPEQAESQLITRLGVRTAGNLRSETDPADW